MIETKSNILTGEPPFFSICIPQYNRTSFLIEACKSLCNQTFKNFEICISDDCSTDNRESELLGFLENTGVSFIYKKQSRNSGYDVNLRASIELARGKYCFLLGNDDCLASPAILEHLNTVIQYYDKPGVIITNYENYNDGDQFRRVRTTGIIGSGPYIAVNNYRNFSFISGIILHTAKAKEHATTKWDGVAMYQMFIGCRIIAEGKALLAANEITVRKDIQIPGEQVDSFMRKPKIHPCPIQERPSALNKTGYLVADSIAPYVKAHERQIMSKRILLQLLLFTYPFWIFMNRKAQSWNYAVGYCLGMRPKNILKELDLNVMQKLLLSGIYGLVSAIGLLIPLRVFKWGFPVFYSLSKSALTLRKKILKGNSA